MLNEHEHVEPSICVCLVGNGSSDFLSMLAAKNIPYVRRIPKPGVVVASGDVVAIAASCIAGLAAVIAAWVSSKASREVSVTHNNYSITQINVVFVVEKIESTLSDAKRIDIIDTAPNGPKNP